MKKLFIVSLYILMMQNSDQFCSDQKTIDLVICNDSFEKIDPNIIDWFSFDTADKPMIHLLNETLLENQLCLCTKSIWILFQNLVQIWEMFIKKSEEEIIKDYERLRSDHEKNQVDYKTVINFQKKWIVKWQKQSTELMQEIDNIEDVSKKYQKAQELIIKFKKKVICIRC